MAQDSHTFQTSAWLVARPVIILLAFGLPLLMGIDFWIFGRQMLFEYPELRLYVLMGYPIGAGMAIVGGWGLYRLALLLAGQVVTVDERGIRIRNWRGREHGYRWEEVTDTNLGRRRSGLECITLTARGRRHLLFNYLRDFERCGEIIGEHLRRAQMV